MTTRDEILKAAQRNLRNLYPCAQVFCTDTNREYRIYWQSAPDADPVLVKTMSEVERLLDIRSIHEIMRDYL